MGRVRVLCFMAVVAIAGPVLAAGAIKVDFGDWDRSQWLPVREERFPKIVPFVQREGYIENFLPAGADEKDIVAAKDGIGVSIMLRRDLTGDILSLRSRMAYDRKGAPSVIFDVHRQGEVITDMYSLVLFVDGLNMWKLKAGKWSKVGASKFAVTPVEYHDVRVLAHRGDFTVYLDGARKLSCSDPEPLAGGEVGIWSGEGPCFFQTFFARPLVKTE